MKNWKIMEIATPHGGSIKMVSGTLDDGRAYMRPISPTLRLEEFAREVEQVNKFYADEMVKLDADMPPVIVDHREVLTSPELLDR